LASIRQIVEKDLQLLISSYEYSNGVHTRGDRLHAYLAMLTALAFEPMRVLPLAM
jgi:hypothetical protein